MNLVMLSNDQVTVLLGALKKYPDLAKAIADQVEPPKPNTIPPVFAVTYWTPEDLDNALQEAGQPVTDVNRQYLYNDLDQDRLTDTTAAMEYLADLAFDFLPKQLTIPV